MTPADDAPFTPSVDGKYGSMHQCAPYPTILAAMVAELQYEPNWEFDLRDRMRDPAPIGEVVGAGLTLTITITCRDSYHPDEMRRVAHLFPVPPATYDERSWRRWLFERILDVHRHEAMENFIIKATRCFASGLITAGSGIRSGRANMVSRLRVPD
jgi:hypothetical protein